MTIPARAREDLHEFSRCGEEVRQPLGGLFDDEASPEPFFFVAMPTGQLLLWQALIPRHPIVWIVECEMGMPSAPRASAFTKSDSVRRPPVMIRVIPSAPTPTCPPHISSSISKAADAGSGRALKGQLPAGRIEA